MRQQRGAVLHLGAVDLTVPRRTAVHQLVTQGVDALKHQRQQLGHVALDQQDGGVAFACGLAFLPSNFVNITALKAPERFKDVGVVEQHADRVAR